VPAVRWLVGNRSTGVPATRVRCRLPARLLRQAGLDSRLIRRREDPLNGPPDVLVVQDPRSDDDAEATHRASALGVHVIVDLSDPVRARSGPARRAVEAAAAVTVRHVGLSPLIDHSVVVQTDDAVEWTHPSPRIRPRPRPGEPARLAWFGVGRGPSEGTGIDELATLGPTLAALARRRRIELIVVTDDRGRADALLRDRAIPGRSVDWSPWRLRSVLAATHVCLLPAHPVEVARVRSANRAVTSLVQGVAVVAGPVPAYEALGRGVAFGSWGTNIARLLADQEAFEEQVGLGRDAVRRRFSDVRIVRQWRSIIDRVNDPVEAPGSLAAG
jgi:hypothetical protein